MVKPDWNIFKAKFSENPQKNFEWFCYLLFCKENNRPLGIFRYKNQSAIETDPIIKDNEVIGLQAKFYETTLSIHKKELIDTITKIKRDYPDLTKVVFYTNQEWGQGKSENSPQAKIAVEQKAEECNLEIEWRTESYFESPFVTINNSNIAQHFFSLDDSIINLLQEKQVHTESILRQIQTNINFDTKIIEIDRSEVLKKIKEELNQKQILILNGTGGVGKTAVIKKLYSTIKEDVPFYIFKANEFNINNINDLFGKFTLKDFVEAHREEDKKIIVIDSAEKLLELGNIEPFKEFLSIVIDNRWSILFTTRNNYLEGLNYQFIEINNVIPANLEIRNLSQEEINGLSQKYDFSLPKDSKLLELIKNPFYLNEYIRFYKEGENLEYLNFKEKLWNNIIKKSKPSREQCFLKIAFERAKEGQFFITPNLNYQVLDELVCDGVLGYETAGYFITHDIYEEWALEKVIKSEYIRKSNNKELFSKLGESLPIRRCFRNWISEQLLLENSNIKKFIEEVIEDDEIAPFWKDELMVAVLLSNYAKTFFYMFKENLLENELILMKKISFLLRITCKEVDSDFLKQLGIKDNDMYSIEYFFTKPKGEGWISFIEFVHDNLDTIGISNINFVLPIINDWTSKFKNGMATRKASLIALKYYQWTIKEDISFLRAEKVKERLFQTIMYGASEIKEELIKVFEEILTNKWNRYRDPYYDFVNAILTKLGDNIEIIKALPEQILKLAKLFWFKIPREEDLYYSSGVGVEKYFCLEESNLDYYPSSSFQTPIYWLLQFNLRETIDFILDFTNNAVQCFAKSDLGRNEIEEVDVFIKDGNYTKQYICNRLWNIYRGTQVAPHVLESMHMALEKFFLERVKNTESKVLETWLFYLLRNTKSASISAVVVSVVLACPEKTLNVAKVLFQTKEFFFYDTRRMLLDQSAKMNFSIGYGLNYRNKIHQHERIKSCDDKHRKKSLEHLVLSYQLFRSEEVSDEEAKKRQEIIWSILDKYYDELPDKSKETVADKTWRLYLTRMDIRKKKLATEKKDGQILISFNPEIDRELKEFSENSLKQNSELIEYSSLDMWADYKIKNDKHYKNYMQYDNNPSLVLKEVKEIVQELKNPNNTNYFFFNKSIPGKACSVLVRDHFNKLSKKEKVFCKDIIIEVASSSLKDDYPYQISDGVESAVFVLPRLLKEFPEDKETIKGILLMILFDDSNIGMYCSFCDYSKKAIINNLWDVSYYDAQSLLYGYLLLKPAYEESRLMIRKENYKKNIYNINKSEIVKDFVKKNEECLQKVINNEITIKDLTNIEKLELYILKNAFDLIPQKTDERDYKNIVKLIISTFSRALLTVNRDDKVNYSVRNGFLEKLVYFVLNVSQQEIIDYLKPFIDGFNSSEVFVDLFKQLIIAEDELESYSKFWFIWHLFYEKLVDLCKDGNRHWYKDEIIKSYLFAKSPWREEIKEWHTLKLSNKNFFKKVADEMGHCPSVLYSISKLLNNIGSIYLNDGILWIYKMLNNNKNLWIDKLEIDTIYYLENIVKRYIYVNRQAIRRTKQLKQQVIVILDFLIEKGSVVGYMLRDNIL